MNKIVTVYVKESDFPERPTGGRPVVREIGTRGIFDEKIKRRIRSGIDCSPKLRKYFVRQSHGDVVVEMFFPPNSTKSAAYV